jgi:serine/threonine protein kinase
MREAEAVAPLCLANTTTKIVLAGDKMQVGPDLLVLGEQPRQRGFSRSLLERLEMHYAKSGASAASYIVKLVTNYRCHQDILSLAEKLFYKFPLKSVVPATSTHPEAPFPLVFVCSDLQVPVPSGNPVNEMEARIVIEQVQKFAPGWPQDYWGAKLDPAQICVMSPSRTQVNKIKELLFSKAMKVPEMLKKIERHPSYDMQGREYRILFLSTYEATDEDGSTRNPTKSIADPYVVNTVVTRARSLVVSVGNPYMLLNMEKHMCKKYGEKAKYWSNYIKRCLEHDSVVFHKSTGVFDADKKGQLDQLNRAVDKQIAAKYNIDDSTGTYSSEATPTQRQATDLEPDECEVPEKYTGRLEFDFTMGEWLGKGGFGHVYEVTSKTDGGSYALKIVRLPDKKSSYKKILREVRGLRKLDQPNNHPNIVRYYSSWVDVAPTDDRKKIAPWKDMEGGKAIPVDDSDSGTSNFVRGDTTADTTVTSANYSSDSAAVTKYTKRDDDTSSTTTSTARAEVGSAGPLHGIPYLLIRTELCGKTLKHWLEHHKKRKRQRLLIYFEQILDAVRYIHSKKLAHRDLKPSNIFRSLGDKDVLKVGDFGLVAGNFGSPDLTSQSRSRQQVSFSGQAGTPLYMSPEQLEHTRCTEKVDIYALGVIYFEMNYVFGTVHEKHKVLKDLQKDFHVPHKFATSLPYETIVIQKMMTHDPDHRPTANHILESRWFDDLKKSVQEDPGRVPSM